MNVKYIGDAGALRGCVISISEEYGCYGYVDSSAIMEIMNAIPDFDSLPLTDSVFHTMPLGDRVVLLFWRVDMSIY